MNRPTFFISSTIYDFQDLRGALKYFLEAQGCRVLASEYNDFTKPLDLNAYHACLKTIEQADYFVLLVGARRGGWYEEANGVTITKKEYQVAYEHHKKGRLKILSFVRQGVWDLKENKAALERHLATIDEINAESKKKASAYPSKFATDAQFITNFLKEVDRNKEAVAAAKGKGSLPTGNWVHTFTTFKDIIDAIGPLIFNGLVVGEAASRKALQMQLLSLLQTVIPKISSKPFIPATKVAGLAQALNVSSDTMFQDIQVDRKVWNTAISLALCLSGLRLTPQTFEPFLASPLLLQYDPTNSSFKATPTYEALVQLVEEMRLFELGKTGANFATLLALDKDPAKKQPVKLPAVTAVALLGALFRWSNIIVLATELARALDGLELRQAAMFPQSPITDQNQMLDQETLSMLELRKHIGLSQ